MQQPEEVDRRQWVRRGQILDPQNERLVAHFDADQQRLVERVEHRDLEQDRKAARGRVDLLGLVELQDLLLLALLVVLEPLLQCLHLRLDLAHRRHRLELLLRDREHDRAHDQCQADDRHPEIAQRVEQPQQQAENRDHEPIEPTPVDGPRELWNARRSRSGRARLFPWPRRTAGSRWLASGPGRRWRRQANNPPGSLRSGLRRNSPVMPALRHEGGQPIFVGEAQPAAVRIERVYASVRRVAEQFRKESRFLAVEILEVHVILAQRH